MIPSLHAAYVRLTGYEIGLNMAREREWFDWLQYRKPPFTEFELMLVIRYLKKEIKQGSRNVGSLKVRNLIGLPDAFEEDLALAKANARGDKPRPAAVHAVSGNPLHAAEVIGSKRILEGLAKWKEENL